MKKLLLVLSWAVLSFNVSCGDDDDDDADDAGPQEDSSVLDGSIQNDSSNGNPDSGDGGSNPDEAVYAEGLHDCTASTYVDQGGTSDDRTVEFGVGGSFYNPSCIQIAVGQEVTFQGTFSTHPLKRGKSSSRPSDPDGAPNNPIPERTGSGSTLGVTFAEPGDFPFHCENHHISSDMYGVVRVGAP